MASLRDHLARRRPKTAFVLGGGGNLGAIQVGMLRGLLERGIRPDLLIGCSVGALNAAALGGDPTLTGVQRLRDLWLQVKGSEIFPGGTLRTPWSVTRKGSSMCPNDGLRRIIEDWCAFRRLEEATVPVHAVATSLWSGREKWFDRGPAVDALLASTALPAVFPPVVIDGEPLIDGGVVDNVPISRALALGAKRIYVLHVGNFDRPRATPKRPIDVLVQAFSIARGYRFRADSVAAPDGVELVTLPGVDPGGLRYNDFSKSRELIRRGYDAAAQFLDTRAATA